MQARSDMTHQPTPPDITLTPTDPHTPDALRLVQGLWDEEEELYGGGGPEPFLPADVSGPGAVFLLARDGSGRAIGCGAVRYLAPGVGEIKRIFVEKPARRRGVARAIMAELERIARERGDHTIRLETGTMQPAAMKMYEELGYTRIASYGTHADDPWSVCFEKGVGSGE